MMGEGGCDDGFDDAIVNEDSIAGVAIEDNLFDELDDTTLYLKR